MIFYILFFIAFILFIFHVYTRLSYGFWSNQPVKHWYNMYYIFSSCGGIINHNLPYKNDLKYINTTNIQTLNFDAVEYNKENYLKHALHIIGQNKEKVLSCFTGHNHPCFWSFYFHNQHLTDSKTGNIIEHEKMCGVLTSRPIHLFFHKEKEKVDAYYADFLCVLKHQRKKNIAYQLIETHHYNQSHMNKNIAFSLFKREGFQRAIVPLSTFSSYVFPCKKWGKPLDFPPQITVLKVDKQNVYHLFEFLKQQAQRKELELLGLPEISNFIFMMDAKRIFAYMVMFNMEIKSAYFFSSGCSEPRTPHCVNGSINGSLVESDFIQGFKISLWKTLSQVDFSSDFIEMENVCDNDILINHVAKKTHPSETKTKNYYFYNFAYKYLYPKNILIIN
jgi:hypothetical protein